MVDFIKEHWVALLFGLLGFAEVVTRLTPTTKDDTVLNWIKSILDVMIPNLKKGGGKLSDPVE